MTCETPPPGFDNWFEVLITKLEEYLSNGNDVAWKDWDGKTVFVKVSKELVELLKENRASLLRIGHKTAKEVFMLLGQGRDLAALVKIYEQLDNDELIMKYKEDSIRLAEIAVQTQTDRKFWKGLVMKTGMRLAFGVVGALI